MAPNICPEGKVELAVPPENGTLRRIYPESKSTQFSLAFLFLFSPLAPVFPPLVKDMCPFDFQQKGSLKGHFAR